MERYCVTHIASRSKGDHTMKFAQLLEHNMGSIFQQKSDTKYDGKTIPRDFPKSRN